MTERSDFPLPLSAESAHAHISPWPQPESEPVNLIAILPGDAAPTLDSVMTALGRGAADEFTLIEQPSPQPRALWNALLAGPALPAPIVVWAEPMAELSPDNVKFLKAENCRWAVGVETALEHEQPHEHLQNIIRILARAFPQSPAILNVNTGGWHTRDEIDDVLLPEEMPAGPALMYMVHAIGDEPPPPSPPDSADADQIAAGVPARLWAYTDGLRTAGRPEMEMHGIAPEDGRFASTLLNSIAEMVFDTGLPAPGEAFEIGDGVFIRFLPWEEAARAASDQWLGSVGRREDHEGRKLEGVRVAVCAMDSLEWPAEAARKMQRGEAALLKTQEATQRETRIARHTLDRFAGMFKAVPSDRRKDTPERVAAFIVKAGFAVPKHAAGEDDREHLWFEITEVKDGRLRGTLLNDPMHVRLQRGETTWIDRNVISDWQIFTPRGQFGPTQFAAAKITIEELLREAKHV